MIYLTAMEIKKIHLSQMAQELSVKAMIQLEKTAKPIMLKLCIEKFDVFMFSWLIYLPIVSLLLSCKNMDKTINNKDDRSNRIYKKIFYENGIKKS